MTREEAELMMSNPVLLKKEATKNTKIILVTYSKLGQQANRMRWN